MSKTWLISCLIMFFISSYAKGEIFFPLDKLKPKEFKPLKYQNTTSSKSSNTTKINTSKFKLTGIVFGKKVLAIINGRIVGVNDTVDECFVKEIKADKGLVILKCGYTGIKLNLNRIIGKKQ